MKRPVNVTMSDFYCTECGRKGIPCMRPDSHRRESGHLKRLWCPYCNKETNHAEIRPNGSYSIEDFYEEYNLGRFTEGSRLDIQDLLICSATNCEYNKNGRCWNSNYSYDCPHRIKKEEIA